MYRRVLLFTFFPFLSIAQNLLTDHETVEIQTQAFLGNQMPFWMRANRYGIIPDQGPAVLAVASLHSDYTQPSRTRPYLRIKRVDWGYGVRFAAQASLTQPRVYLQEAYVKGKIGFWEAYAGKRNEQYGIADSTLGIGPYSWSGHALPVPKVQMGFPNWTPLFSSRLSIQGIIAHGWLDDPEAFVRHAYLHQKTFYVKIGQHTDPVSGFLGINHQVQWAGVAPSLREKESAEKDRYFEPDGSLPADAAAFRSVFTGARSSSDSYNPYDRHERVGNHVGSIDLALQIQSPYRRILIYRQQPFEKPSLLYLSNIRDGLTGISITNQENPGTVQIRKLTLEFLYLKNQGRYGSVFKSGPVWMEQYFNHWQYRQGWSYRGQTLGTPLITPVRPTNTTFDDKQFFTAHNLLSAIHLGLEGQLFNAWKFDSRISYLHSDGTSDQRRLTPDQQLCFAIRMRKSVWLFQGSEIQATAAADIGEILPTSIAFSVGLSKKWGFVDENISESTRHALRHRRRSWY